MKMKDKDYIYEIVLILGVIYALVYHALETTHPKVCYDKFINSLVVNSCTMYEGKK